MNTLSPEAEGDIQCVLVAWRAYGQQNADAVFREVCEARKLKRFEAVMLADKIRAEYSGRWPNQKGA